MRIGSLVLLVLAATATWAEPPAAVPGDAQDLLLFLDKRPYLIRLHLQIEGRSFQTSWETTVGHLFRYLDVNGDGTLSKKEAMLAPSNTQWMQLMSGTAVEPDAAPDFAALAGGPTKTTVTRPHFVRYYQNSGAGALQVEWGWRWRPPAQDLLTDALFRRIDKNKDGVLSREELSATQEALHLLDADGDEIIRATELAAHDANPTYEFRAATDRQPVPKDFPFVILQPGTPVKMLTEQLLTRFDLDKDRKLSRTEWSLEKVAFDRLDSNGDGQLNATELAGWRNLPPELEWIVPLGKSTRRDILIVPSADGKPARAAAFSPSREGALRVPVEEKQLELERRNTITSLRKELLKQFDTLAGKRGILDEKTIYQPPFTFVALLRLADRDGDNRLSRREIADFLDVREESFFRTTYLTVIDRGQSLFEMLDADHDGRLTPREQRAAWTRLAPWDRTGPLTRQRLPRQFQLIVRHGQPRANGSPVTAGYGNSPVVRDRSRGPLWFRKMDRNGDGDVSQAEFLGTGEQFRRIDADGDGLLDVTEAEKADRYFRKRP